MTEKEIVEKTVDIFSNFKKLGYFLVTMEETESDQKEDTTTIRINTNMSVGEIYDMFDAVDFNTIDYFKRD